MSSLLRAENLRRRADGRLLLSPTSLSAAAGEFVKVVGGNGAGKTTLLKILCRLLMPDGGVLCWNGGDVEDNLDDYREELLYVGHKNALADDLTPLENLRASALLRRRTPAADLSDALAQAGLAGAARRRCRWLSAGQRRRAALARLRAFRARLWILDEPLATLDKDGRRMLGDWLSAHLSAGGVAIASMHAADDFPTPAARVVHCGGGG